MASARAAAALRQLTRPDSHLSRRHLGVSACGRGCLRSPWRIGMATKGATAGGGEGGMRRSQRWRRQERGGGSRWEHSGWRERGRQRLGGWASTDRQRTAGKGSEQRRTESVDRVSMRFGSLASLHWLTPGCGRCGRVQQPARQPAAACRGALAAVPSRAVPPICRTPATDYRPPSPSSLLLLHLLWLMQARG